MKRFWKSMLCITMALLMVMLTAEPALAATKEKYTYTVKTATAGTKVQG